MRLARITIICDCASGPRGAAALVDFLWAFVESRDGLEHITVRSAADPDRFEVGMFTRSADDLECQATAFDVVERALRNSPRFRGWKIVETRNVRISESGP